MAQTDKKLCHPPYLRNHASYDDHFWCVSVNLQYLQVFFFFIFSKFPGCQGGGGGVKQEMAQNYKNMSVGFHISGTIHHMIKIYGTHV